MTAPMQHRAMRPIVSLLLLLFPALSFPDTPAWSDTRLSMGGFARLHWLVGDVSDGAPSSGDQKLYVPHIPVTARPDSDRWRTTFHGKDSRIWFRGETPEHSGEATALEALFEADLHDSAESHRLRVRHAWLRYGRLLAGQTYTAFTQVSALADIEAAIAVGNTVTRHDVLRWTQPLSAADELVVSLEAPLSRIAEAGTLRSATVSDRPDVILRWDRRIGAGSVSVSGLIRRVEDEGTDMDAGNSRRATAYSVSGKLFAGPLDNLRFAFAHGDGLARYATPGTFADAIRAPDGALLQTKLTSATIAWQHYWQPTLRSSLVFSRVRADLPHATAGTLTRHTRSAHANLIWTQGQRWSLGVEYLYGQRTRQDGRSGQVNRVQFTGRLNFRASLMP